MIIYKYMITPILDLELPKDAKILAVQIQRGEPQMWVLHDPFAEKTTRKFVAVGTGAYFESDNLNYIGTFQLPTGLVYHLFEVLK